MAHADGADAVDVLRRRVLDIERFLGGDMKLDANGARAAIERAIAEPLSISIEQAADFGLSPDEELALDALGVGVLG